MASSNVLTHNLFLSLHFTEVFGSVHRGITTIARGLASVEFFASATVSVVEHLINT